MTTPMVSPSDEKKRATDVFISKVAEHGHNTTPFHELPIAVVSDAINAALLAQPSEPVGWKRAQNETLDRVLNHLNTIDTEGMTPDQVRRHIYGEVAAMQASPQPSPEVIERLLADKAFRIELAAQFMFAGSDAPVPDAALTQCIKLITRQALEQKP